MWSDLLPSFPNLALQEISWDSSEKMETRKREVTEKGRKSSRRSEEPGEEVSKDTQKKQNGAMKTQNTGKNQEIIPEVGSSK